MAERQCGQESLAGLALRALAALMKLARGLLFAWTLPLTQHLLSRRPHAPSLAVVDARVNRVRVRVRPDLSSPFNVEQYELQLRPAAAEGQGQGAQEGQEDGEGRQEEQHRGDWQTAGVGGHWERNLCGLQGGRSYLLRARASNRRGRSSWSEPLRVCTRQWPVQGGGRGPGYRWRQTAEQVTITLQLPEHIADAGHVRCLLVEGRQLKVVVGPAAGDSGSSSGGGGGGGALLEGQLHAPVHGWGGGSTWSVCGQGGRQALVITLQKLEDGRSARLHFWPSALRGHPEIDTHALPEPDSGGQLQAGAAAAGAGGAAAGSALLELLDGSTDSASGVVEGANAVFAGAMAAA